MKAGFQIGEFKFAISCPDTLPFPANMAGFQIPLEEGMYEYRIELTASFPEPNSKLINDRGNLQVYDDHGYEIRYIRLKGRNELYGYYHEISDKEARILFNQEYISLYHLDPVFVSLLVLEKYMIAKGSLTLHCAYMNHNGRAILFSAPSETGKTTQANLWKQYRGCDTVNGDRALLRQIDGTWHACGWPVCGSSGVCHNKELPVEAIVMLSQAPTNRIELLHPMKAFSQVYSQITINRWNNSAHTKAMDLIEHLVGSVPVYHLACNISEDAVICLEDALTRII